MKRTIRERGGAEWEKLERETNHEKEKRTLGNKGLQQGRRAGGWGDWVTGTEEGT